jgi:general secretion pathway protein J
MKPLDRCKPRSAPQRRGAGFTLIELLVAMAILAVVALLAWRGLDQVARGRDTLSRVTENERALSQLYDQMHSDIQQAASDNEISAPPIRTAQHSLQIVRELRLPDQTTRLEVIRYQLRDGHVLRYASPALVTVGQLRTAQAPNAGVDGWSTVDLVEGVTDFSTRLYLPHSGWVDSNSGAQQAFNTNLKALSLPVGGGPLPRSISGVEFKMYVLGQQGPLTRVFVVGE